MALVKCKECGKEVASSAKTCPHCGIKDPGFGAKQKAGGCLGMIVIVGLISYWLASSDSDDKSPKSNQTACKPTDGECIAKEMMFDVDVVLGCKTPIQKASKFEYEWTDGVMSPTFSRYILSKDNKTIILIGDQLKVTNAFNAKLPMIYHCTVDVKSHAVTDVKVEQGRL